MVNKSAWQNSFPRLIVVLLFAGSAINYLDRSLLSVVMPQVRRDLLLSNADYGLAIHAFLVMYGVFYILGGRIADRRGYRRTFTLAVAFWSLAAMAHAFVRGLSSLFLCRALLGVRDPTGTRRLAPPNENPLKTLVFSAAIAWQIPKVGIGGIVRTINSAAQLGFLVFLPVYCTTAVGFTLAQWLRLLTLLSVTNVIWNLLFGFIGDKFGWRRTVALFGGAGCAVTTLMLYYSLQGHPANYALAVVAGMFYGATLSAYTPLGAIMAALAPGRKGAAMAILNLGAGASTWVGPAIVGLFLPSLGAGGVMWIFAVLYAVSAVLTMFMKVPEDRAAA